jgi:hypothetical protein
MALVMVVSVVAVAAVLGYALLASSQLQAQAGGNAVRSASAEYLADSGIQLALWHLQNSGGQWSGSSGISLGSSVPGTVDVVCQSMGSNQYQVTATSHLNQATRQAGALVQLVYPLAITSGNAGGGGLLDLLGNVLQLVGNVVNTLLGGQSIALSQPQQLTQMPAGAQELYSPLNGSYGQDAPGQVFWINGDATVGSDVVIRGQLIVTGNLTVSGTGIRITATSDQPVTGSWPAALVVGKKLLPGIYSQISIDGGLWAGTQIGDNKFVLGVIPVLNGWYSKVNVTGPVMVGDGSISSSFRGTLTVHPLIKVLAWNPAADIN